jgi:CRP-like cAMP-binding protein
MLTAIHPNILRNSFLFKECSEDVLAFVSAEATTMSLNADDMLFEQGSDPDAFYILEAGQVHVVRNYPNGEEHIIATESPYYVIGELSLLANRERTGSVVAVGDCEMVVVKRETVLQALERFPEIAQHAIEHFGVRLYRLNLRVRESAIGNINVRIANMLLLMANEAGDIQGVRVAQMARASAIDADFIARLLKKWHNEGIITHKDDHIHINDLTALQNIAH